ncbi:unnamed protein product [Phytomonas sp. Hart1]|nr:unnamed protein product [Phytomonas sp. Hart1]|eukprot:CCW70978.1 unnamed protein product [Phytomonas sp. isolate Hart1]
MERLQTQLMELEVDLARRLVAATAAQPCEEGDKGDNSNKKGAALSSFPRAEFHPCESSNRVIVRFMKPAPAFRAAEHLFWSDDHINNSDDANDVVVMLMNALEASFPQGYPVIPCRWKVTKEATGVGFPPRPVKYFFSPSGCERGLEKRGEWRDWGGKVLFAHAAGAERMLRWLTDAHREKRAGDGDPHGGAFFSAVRASVGWSTPFLDDFIFLQRGWEALEWDGDGDDITLLEGGLGWGQPARGPNGGGNSKTGGLHNNTEAGAGVGRLNSILSPLTSNTATRGRDRAGEGARTPSTMPSPSVVAIAFPPSPPSADANGAFRRGKRRFAAVLLPQGGIMAWMCAAKVSEKDEKADHFESFYAGTPSEEEEKLTNTTPVPAFNNAARGLHTRILFTTVFPSGKRLPSLLLPSLVLRAKGQRCRWRDIHLYPSNAGSSSSSSENNISGLMHTAAVALRANAKLCRHLRLPKVANLLSVLYQLSRDIPIGNAPGDGFIPDDSNPGGNSVIHTYFREVLVPVLVRTVRALQKARQPFWAGVAVCCLLLPSTLGVDKNKSINSHIVKGGGAPAMTSFLCDSKECTAVVALVERVFHLADCQTQMCEAGRVRRALEREERKEILRRIRELRIEGGMRIIGSGWGSHFTMDSPTIPRCSCVRHAPIYNCAMCDLPLQSCHRLPDNGEETQTEKVDMKPRGGPSVEGCLVVQCARCGHGGHVEHIQAFWRNPKVNCCPKGCDCKCIY